MITNKHHLALSPLATAIKVAIVGVGLAGHSAGQAATIHVGGPNGAGCGLSAAILSANNDVSHPGSRCVAGSGDDIIELHRDVLIRRGFHTSYTGMPIIESALVINGNGHTVRRDDNAPAVRIFEIDTDQNVALNSLTITGGLLESPSNLLLVLRGAGIDVVRVDELTLNNSTISNNVNNVLTSSGGGLNIFASNSVSISNSRIINNSANSNDIRRQGDGGGISVYAIDDNGTDITITDSEISSNSAANGGGGISIFRSSGVNLTIENSAINHNVSSGGGGGLRLSTDGVVQINNSEISNNIATVGVGGGVSLTSVPDYGAYNTYYSSGEMTISNSTLANNTASSSGGSLFSGMCRSCGESAPILIESSTISGNSSAGSGGAILVEGDVTIDKSTIFDNSASADGGALQSGSLTLLNSSLFNNIAGGSGGGISLLEAGTFFYYEASLDVINSTISGNSATQNGGGIFVDNYVYSSIEPVLNIVNSTITANNANNGGGVDTGNGVTTIANTLIVGNTSSSAQEVSRDSSAESIVTSQNNLLGTSLSSNYQAFVNFTPSNTDITATIDGTAPSLLTDIIGPLQDNSGPTLTHALSANSPALAMGSPSVCFDAPVNQLDQRGAARLNGSPCDIGAYESESLITLPFSFAVDSTNRNVIENVNTVSIVVSLDAPQPIPVSVDFKTVDGSAESGSDYTARSGRINFAAGETEKVRSIQINNDGLLENDESFSFELLNPIGGFVQRERSNITILDDDNADALPTIRFGPPNFPVKEGANASMRFTFSLDRAVPFPVSVDFATLPGNNDRLPNQLTEPATPDIDFVARSGTITFAPGEILKQRYVQIIEDGINEPDESIRIELSNPVNAQVTSNLSGNGVISDSNKPTVSVAVENDGFVNEADRKVRLDVLLSEPQDYRVRVTFRAGAGTPFRNNIARSGFIVFSPGQTVARRYIELVQDDIAEPEASFVFELTRFENADPELTEQTITIIDDD